MFNPFNSDAENTSFERGGPVGQVAKSMVKVSAQQAKQQSDDFTKSFLQQLYGPSSPDSDQGDKPSDDVTKQKMQTAAGSEQDKTTLVTGKQLQQAHRRDYFDKYFGDGARKKREQEEAQKMQVKQQEEQEQQQRLAGEKAQENEGLGMVGIAGKKASGSGGKRRMQKPLEVVQKSTKTEANRGTIG
jgi:hypothetical protein